MILLADAISDTTNAVFLDFVTRFGPYVVLTILGIGVVIWFVLKRHLEGRIDNKFAKDLEQHKTDLQIVAFTNQVRFQHLHEKQAEVIAKVFELLNGTYQQTLAMKQVSNENAREFALRTKMWLEYLGNNSIYLPASVRMQLHEIHVQSEEIASHFAELSRCNKITDDAIKEYQRKVTKSLTSISEARELLYNDFQSLLGVQSIEKKDQQK